MAYNLSDIFFLCAGVASSTEMIIDFTELAKAEFMDIEDFVNTQAHDSTAEYQRAWLRQIQGKVQNREDLTPFLGIGDVAMEYRIPGSEKAIGKLYYPKGIVQDWE